MTVKGYREGSTREKDIPGVVWRIQAHASSVLPPRATLILLLPSAGTCLPAFQTFRRKHINHGVCTNLLGRLVQQNPMPQVDKVALSGSNVGTLREAKFSDAGVRTSPQAGPSDSGQLW